MAGRILVVEDEVVIAMEIESVLQQLGYTPVGNAMTGADAIELATRLHPDLVLMDIRLKGDIDGIAAGEKIYRLARIPVIFLTAHSDPSTLERAMALHPFGYLIKPFRKNELFTTIEIALYKHRALLAEEELKRELFKVHVIDHITQYDIYNKTLAIRGYLDIIGGDLSPDPAVQDRYAKMKALLHEIDRQIQFEGEYRMLGEKKAEWQDIPAIVLRERDKCLAARIRTEVKTGGLEIFADPFFELVFRRIFENIAQHGRTADLVQVSFHDEGTCGRLIIEDNGTGIANEEKARLFSRDLLQSRGKGLFLVQEILQISGMTITETGTAGSGARFEILIPPEKFRLTTGEA